jgi:signal transduction histidine kinase
MADRPALQGIDRVTGSYSYTPEVWPALVTLALMVFLGQYSWRRRHIPGARLFAVACAVCAPWILGVIMEISAVAISTQVFWYQFQAVWPMAAAATITCFILRFAGLESWLNWRTCALLFLVPVLNAITVATNGIHHLMWTGFETAPHVVPLHGPLYLFFNSYVYLLGLINLAVLVWLAVRSPGHRWPVAIIVCGQILGRVGYALDRMDTGWFGPGESAFFSVGLVGIAYAVAFLGFHIIDPVVVARTSVLKQMREGMLVLDTKGRILDVNPMGASILGIPFSRLRGRSLSELFPLDSGIQGGSDDMGTGQAEIVLGPPESARTYEMNRTQLNDRKGNRIGGLLLLHDVTEHRQAQARLLEQQEVVTTLRERERLARELHDGIGQTFGFVGLQTQAALQWVSGGNLEKAETALRRLSSVAKEAHADVRESILGLKTGSLDGWSFIPALRAYLGKYETNYGIRTQLVMPDGIGEEMFEPAAGVHLLRVVQEALSNSRRHGGAANLQVRIGMNGASALVTIVDDGRGFDASRIGGAGDGHFGLAFMRERMQQIGGSMEIDSTPGAGTVLTLHVPVGDHGRRVRESSTG